MLHTYDKPIIAIFNKVTPSNNAPNNNKNTNITSLKVTILMLHPPLLYLFNNCPKIHPICIIPSCLLPCPLCPGPEYAPQNYSLLRLDPYIDYSP